jgi:hypothetical protein
MLAGKWRMTLVAAELDNELHIVQRLRISLQLGSEQD